MADMNIQATANEFERLWKALTEEADRRQYVYRQEYARVQPLIEAATDACNAMSRLRSFHRAENAVDFDTALDAMRR